MSNFNWFLFLPTLFLLSFSLLILSSSNPSLVLPQLTFSILGLLFFFLLSFLDINLIKNFSLPIYLSTIIFLAVVFLIGIETRGATRWIDLGIFRFQPSEFVKPLLILVLASFISSHDMQKFKNVLLSFLLVLIPVFFVFRQPDLGNTLVILAIWLGMFIASGLRPLYLIGGLATFLASFPLIWSFLRDYQKQRILTFLNPMIDPLGTGYTTIQASIAVGSGQIFGRGLGQGTQSQLQFLPEHSTDFIFAALAEELGFLGAFLLLASFFFLIWQILKTAENSQNLFGSLVCMGVLGMLLFQVLVNVGMNIGLIPITGITLPLVSYGGSSLVATLISLGLVASVFKTGKLKERREELKIIK